MHKVGFGGWVQPSKLSGVYLSLDLVPQAADGFHTEHRYMQSENTDNDGEYGGEDANISEKCAATNPHYTLGSRCWVTNNHFTVEMRWS